MQFSRIASTARRLPSILISATAAACGPFRRHRHPSWIRAMSAGERERAERRLAAILAADVAGYSRLMGGDEEGTLERLKEHRRLLVDPKLAEHHGRIVKTTGDGLLVEFSSVVAAVRCWV